MSTEHLWPLYDMHCHLDFAANGAVLAPEAADAGIRAFSTTVDPRDYEAARHRFAEVPAVHVGLGLHPWWLADGRCGKDELQLFADLVEGARFIGEVGLDFAPRREGTFEYQRSVLAGLMRSCAGGGRLFSFHSVRAASALLDVLEDTGVLSGSVAILHWFSGTSEELARAVRLGCRFSVGSRMLATKRGRSYARSMPLERLMLESDLPNEPGEPLELDRWRADLEGALGELADLRAMEPRAMADQLARNSEAALCIG